MFLTIACLLLLSVIGLQNWLYPQLRALTVSDGLYQEVPNYWALDASYVVLSVALSFTAYQTHSFIAFALALFASAAFMVTAISNTFATWVDKETGGIHNKIHTDATIGMFVAALALQAVENHTWLWWLSGAALILPALTYVESKRFGWPAGPNAEKAAVFMLCAWLIAWSQSL